MQTHDAVKLMLELSGIIVANKVLVMYLTPIIVELA